MSVGSDQRIVRVRVFAVYFPVMLWQGFYTTPTTRLRDEFQALHATSASLSSSLPNSLFPPAFSFSLFWRPLSDNHGDHENTCHCIHGDHITIETLNFGSGGLSNAKTSRLHFILLVQFDSMMPMCCFVVPKVFWMLCCYAVAKVFWVVAWVLLSSC